jgi:hypothetical protein
MGLFVEQIESKQIYFSNHALDRWWERCTENKLNSRTEAMQMLRDNLKESEVSEIIPEWSQVNKQHRSKADHFIKIDNDSGFVINKNPNGDFVAVTFIDKLTENN